MEPQTRMTDGTIVTFAGGSLTEQARVVYAAPLNDHFIIVTDRTPFHPQSLSWPDQPGDRGDLVLSDGRRAQVLDSREGLQNRATGVLFMGEAALGIKRGDPDIQAVVLHLLQEDLSPATGAAVTLTVDKNYRDALSLQHTAVHLAALALNHCAVPFWTKDPGDPDTLGAPNLDKAAVTQSRITVDCSTDVYRIGKSLRKKGFHREAFLSDLPDRARSVNEALVRLLTDPAPVELTPVEGYLGDRRLWSTRLNGVNVAMPCGGTHVAHLGRIKRITVEFAPTEDGFVMLTHGVSGVL